MYGKFSFTFISAFISLVVIGVSPTGFIYIYSLPISPLFSYIHKSLNTLLVFLSNISTEPFSFISTLRFSFSNILLLTTIVLFSIVLSLSSTNAYVSHPNDFIFLVKSSTLTYLA